MNRNVGYGFGIASVIAFGAWGCGDGAHPTYAAGGGADASPGGGDDGAPAPQRDASADDAGDAQPGAGVLPGPSRGSAVALSPDDSVAVVVNRDVGSVSVFAIAYPGDGAAPQVTKTGEVPLGAGSEPWQAVIAPDNATAYVVLRKDQKLVKVGGLKSAPAEIARVAVGSEPTGVALTPTGARAWVANWVDGTLMGIDTASMQVASTVDLNVALVATKLLPVFSARPALAHPRSVAITNNGDASDADESIYVTEYFAQRTEPEDAAGANADRSKSGLVYKVKVADKSVTTIPLAPLADMGFADHNGATAGCYPNQLQSITINGSFAYVTSICASPKGPIGVFTGPAGAACTTDAQCGKNGGKCVNSACAPNLADVKTTTAPLVSVIDLASDAEVASATASLNAPFDALYTTRGAPDDGTRRFPAVPMDVAFVPGTGVAYVAANAADAVFRVQYDAASSSKLSGVGAPSNAFIDLNPSGIAAASAGKNPIGIATTSTAGRKFAFVANDVSRNLSVLDLNTQSVAGGASAPDVVASAALPTAGSPEAHALAGKRFFDTGVGRWSLKGQAWGACQSCHTDGLTDDVTWYFARGPRQSTSLDGTFASKDPTDQRILNWTAINDELPDFEGNTRGISGGVGALVAAVSAPPAIADRLDTSKASGLNGSSALLADPTNPGGLAQVSAIDDWLNITAYVQQLRSPRRPTNLDDAKVAAGRALFTVDGACQGCHGGDKWTISKRFYAPSASTMSALATTSWAAPAGFPQALLPASANRYARFPSTNAGLDQIQCVLRPVGTYGVADPSAGIAELRADMITAAQGNETDGKGFNPPSLLALATGGPYLHAGQAPTLESLFAPTFAAHHAGPLAPNFLADSDPNARGQKVDELVQYLLSIDEDEPPIAIPAPGAQGGDFCPTH